METRLDEYLTAGVRLVWVVCVPTRNVWADRSQNQAASPGPVSAVAGVEAEAP